MTYNVKISDGGVSVKQTIEAKNIEAAVEIVETQMRETEDVTAGNPDCEPRTAWHTIIVRSDFAECTLRGDSQDAATWAKVTIELA